MPSWNELLDQVNRPANPNDKSRLLNELHDQSLQRIAQLRGDRNVILYASAFLQKPHIPQTGISGEEINGFMSVVYGMDWNKGLTLLLHTPGGVTNAAETIVAYLWSKFSDIEVIVPTYAMSAGTMIALATNRIVMGRQSQLGPIDPQMIMSGGKPVSARAIVEQFEKAAVEIDRDRQRAHLWAPILQTLGPANLQEAQNALDYGQRMVAQWLQRAMFKDREDRVVLSERVAAYFNDASEHKSHGRRIDRDEARRQEIIVEDLEDNQELQEAVLTAYHLATIGFEQGRAYKIMRSHHGRQWIKNETQQVPVQIKGLPIPQPNEPEKQPKPALPVPPKPNYPPPEGARRHGKGKRR